MLSYGIWQRRFGADPAVVGQTLRLDGKPLTIVGVMPADFQGVGAGPLLWVPWVLTPDEQANRQTHEFFALARTQDFRDPGTSASPNVRSLPAA